MVKKSKNHPVKPVRKLKKTENEPADKRDA